MLRVTNRNLQNRKLEVFPLLFYYDNKNPEIMTKTQDCHVNMCITTTTEPDPQVNLPFLVALKPPW